MDLLWLIDYNKKLDCCYIPPEPGITIENSTNKGIEKTLRQ